MVKVTRSQVEQLR